MKKRVFCLTILLAAGCLASGCGPSGAVRPAERTPAASAALPVPTPTPTPAPTPEPVLSHETLEALVAGSGEAHHAMAIQAAVIDGGVVTDCCAWGWAAYGETPMTDSHKLRAASLTKVAVGLSAALLMDQGMVDPWEDIGVYWDTAVCNPAYPDVPVTVDSLLTHTSSLSETSSLSALGGSAARRRLEGSGYRAVAPGDPAGWAYNNYGFSVLGMTLELAADRTLDQVLGEGLLAPMGIDAAFEPGSVEQTELLAQLYQGGSLTRSVEEQLGYVCFGVPGEKGNFFAGGFMCSAADLARLTALLANDGVYEGQALLSPQAVDYLETPMDPPITYRETTFSQCRPLRLRAGVYGRARLYYHTGSAYGFYGFLSYDPETRDGVVAFSTGADGSVDEWGVYAVCGDIAQGVYAALAGEEAAICALS